jgi:kinesin family protein 1
MDAREEALLRKFLVIWKKPSIEMSNPIFKSNDESASPRVDDTSTNTPELSAGSTRKTRYLAAVTSVPKNITSLKSGYLLMPSESHEQGHSQSMQWKRRFVDLRPPYLYIHSVPDGEGINAINLTHAHIDHDPDFKRLLGSGSSVSSSDGVSGHRRSGSAEIHGLAHVFAVYGEQNTFLFAARSESQKMEWILKIDQSYFEDEEEEEA